MQYCIARGTDLGPAGENFGAACDQTDRTDKLLAGAHSRARHRSRVPEASWPETEDAPDPAAPRPARSPSSSMPLPPASPCSPSPRTLASAKLLRKLRGAAQDQSQTGRIRKFDELAPGWKKSSSASTC
jgi:hypothetical protein